VREQLAAAKIATAIHYPVPIHQQPAYASLHTSTLPQTVAAASEILSLPMHPLLTTQQVAQVAAALHAALD
jgi:dTDP-4-amino-4,6-dideoxygalactose transaminase